MSDPKHLQDCNFRSNQEREIIEEQRNEAIKKEEERKLEESRLAKEEAEFQEKEKIRRGNIANRNKSYKS